MTDVKDLKIQSLLEQLSQNTASAEDRIANFRVQLHQTTERVQQLEQENAELRAKVEQADGSADGEVVETKGTKKK